MSEERTDRTTSFACIRIHIYNRLLFERTVISVLESIKSVNFLILDSSLFHTPISILLFQYPFCVLADTVIS